MRWSWRIARIAGIDVRVHATFLLLLAWVGWDALQRDGGRYALGAVGFVALVFGIVVLHEYGHALAARRYGIGTRDITLLPIGGVARLERMPREPRQELVVALAGPAVNVVLAALLWAALAASRGAGAIDAFAPTDAPQFFSRTLAEQLLRVNVWLAAFNLIPAFPMDGGRVLRAILAMRSGDYATATVHAAKIGRALALVGALGGLFLWKQPMIVLVALFVWMSAAGEAGAVQEQSALDGVPLEEVMVTDVRTLAPHDPLAHAVELILAGFQQDFPVLEDGEVVGVLGRRDLLRVLAERGEGASVGSAMRRDFQVAVAGEPVEDALARLQASGFHAIPVVDGRRLLGLLTLDNVGEYVMIRAALRTKAV